MSVRSFMIDITRSRSFTSDPYQSLYVIYGSRGWGGVKYSTIKDQDVFYNKFEANGFKSIRLTNGYFVNDKLAHSANQQFFKDIVQKLGEINSH